MIRAFIVLLLMSATALAQSEPVQVAPSPDWVTPQWKKPPKPRAPWTLHGMIAVGPTFHELYGIPYGTAELQLRLGGDVRHFGLYGEVIGEVGAAEPRLPIEHLRAGLLVQYINGRWRLGTGVRLGEIFVQRATESETNYGLSWSLYVMGSVDVYRWSRRALYLGVEVGCDLIWFPGNAAGDSAIDVSPMAALQVGLRL